MIDSVWVSDVLKRAVEAFGMAGALERSYFTTSPDGAPLENPRDAQSRLYRGERIGRTGFPEFLYVANKTLWLRAGDLFTSNDLWLLAKPRLAEVLQHFDLGAGGLVEVTINDADKVTPLPGPFYFINFGAVKDSFLPEESRKLREFYTLAKHGRELWDTHGMEDGSIAVSSAALEGPDLWFEKRLRSKIFMSGRLHDALLAANLKADFLFSQARVVKVD